MKKFLSIFILISLVIAVAFQTSPAAGGNEPGASPGAKSQKQEKIITLKPGEKWEGTCVSAKYLTVQARLNNHIPAGAQYSMAIMLKGKPLALSLKNKAQKYQFADGRSFHYYDQKSQAWMVFYSPDFSSNNGPEGGGYQVMTDRGQAYLYRWDISSLAPSGTMHLVITNTNSNYTLLFTLK